MSTNRLIEKFMNDEEANEMFSMENKIKETGRTEGSANEKTSIAQKMLKRNCDYSFISEMTCLSTLEIETLHRKLATV